MKVAQHVDKSRRIFLSLTKLSPARDPLLWSWGAHVALIHLYNAALHTVGATAEEESFPTQRAGTYVRTRAEGFKIDAEAPIADVLHVDLPVLAQARPDWVREAEADLRVIERCAMALARSDGPAAEGPAPLRRRITNCMSTLCAGLAVPPMPL